MAKEWLKAAQALKFVAAGTGDQETARTRILESAFNGRIDAKAELFGSGDQRCSSVEVPRLFWTPSGRALIEEHWDTGFFRAPSEEGGATDAFDVSFDFVALSELLSVETRPLALAAISVLGNVHWISAQEVFGLMLEKVGPSNASNALIEACNLGQLAGRAMRATATRKSGSHIYPSWNSLEWDIPLWFWRECVSARKSVVDWQIGRICGETHGRTGLDRGLQQLELQGVHFHRSGLVTLGIDKKDKVQEVDLGATKRGRSPKYDWPAASIAVFGLIHRGDFKPRTQAEVERALIDNLSNGDDGPTESTVRPYARMIWQEHQKA